MKPSKQCKKGGKRPGAGRPAGATGKEIKKPVTLRAYPSDLERIKAAGMSLQKILDQALKTFRVQTDSHTKTYKGEINVNTTGY